ncbi:MAG: tRNA (guanosine(37)-N1)-methyltransferase TrmD [Desulfotalea sp.]
MLFNILTIFPHLFASPLEEGILKRAISENDIDINIINVRDYTNDRHSTTDDRPFGGGEGMVMKPEPLSSAVRNIQTLGKVIFLSPQGRKYTQRVAEELAEENSITLVCGRYEGIDQRFCDKYVDDEISLGDFILTGGELAALMVIDSVTRILPGVLGCSASVDKDTFSRNLLKHPQYTRPRVFENIEVPEILLSGNHSAIEEFRFVSSIRRTIERRPSLLENENFDKKELKMLKKHGLLKEILYIQKCED